MNLNLALLTSSLSSAAGGLSVSVRGIAYAIAKTERINIHVIGLTDKNNPDEAFSWGPRVWPHNVIGPKHFGCAPSLSTTLSQLAPDIIDAQGLWMWTSLASLRHHRKFGTPYVLTPHGMLDPWALKRSTLKKQIVKHWFENAHIASAACLRATAEMEAEHFRNVGLRNPIAIVPNGVDIPTILPPRLRERRRLLFLSRIHPKKGIDLLLRAWSSLEGARPDWDLIIAGPDEVGHTNVMKELSRSLGLRRVHWLPAVYGDAKSTLYRSADCFILPTYAENFGLVVAEALAHEVPVITTRNAPWHDLLTHRCGWWIDLNEIFLKQALEDATSRPREELWEMGERGRAWMGRDFGWGGVAEKMCEVYQWVVKGGSAPTTVQF